MPRHHVCKADDEIVRALITAAAADPRTEDQISLDAGLTITTMSRLRQGGNPTIKVLRALGSQLGMKLEWRYDIVQTP